MAQFDVDGGGGQADARSEDAEAAAIRDSETFGFPTSVILSGDASYSLSTTTSYAFTTSPALPRTEHAYGCASSA